MKNLISLIALILLPTAFILSQQLVPQGMKYQAVARDFNENVLANKPVTLKITLHSPELGEQFSYTETHQQQTNALGLFALTIGEGKVQKGQFDKIPWSNTDIYMAVSIYDDKSGQFVDISDSRLLAVPYAFHATTATRVINNDEPKGVESAKGVPANVWSLKGNSKTDPTTDKLGTTDAADLIIITNNIERIKIAQNGEVSIQQNLTVENQSTTLLTGDLQVDQDLNVDGNTTLNGTLNVKEATQLDDDISVGGDASFNKDVSIVGSSKLNDSLSVLNEAPTLLSGSLVVCGPATFKDSLNSLGYSKFADKVSISGALYLEDSLSVLNGAPTYLSGKFDVDGPTTINNNVQINDNLSLTDNDASFIATLENTNDGGGDGLKIKLGKTHPRWNQNGEIELTLPGLDYIEGTVNITKNILMNFIDNGGTLNGGDFEQLGNEMIRLTEEQFAPGFDFVTAAACNFTNDIIADVNSGLSLPVSVKVELPEIDVIGSIIGDIGFDLSIPKKTLFNETIIPSIPAIPGCPTTVPSFASSFDIPNLQLVDVNNTLNSDNKFIQFTDKDDRVLGAIEAQSIEEWGHSYLNATFFLNLFNSFAGVTVIGLDPIQIVETAGKYAINGVAQISTIINDYNSIGVAYNSGFGDYAEWLERENVEEHISAGDIVGVRGGKISKNIEGAEQIMAVSTNPIVLGNAPEEKFSKNGNKIAFMGQIPIKIMGPVNSGDFIVAKGEIPGYGIAVNANDMTVEDYALAVGRSWESNYSEGPKMVNTVIGVHNGNMIQVMKKVTAKQNETESRLSKIEKQLSSLIPIAKAN